MGDEGLGVDDRAVGEGVGDVDAVDAGRATLAGVTSDGVVSVRASGLPNLVETVSREDLGPQGERRA